MDIYRLKGAFINDEFMMFDNLADINNSHKVECEKMIKTVISPYPIKLSRPTAYICVDGHIRFRVNLNEYVLHKNEILILLTGTISECLDYSSDASVAIISFADDYFSPMEHVRELLDVQNMVHLSPLIKLSSVQMESIITLYHMMKSRIDDTSDRFRKFALKGYAQVLCAMALNHLSTVETRPTEPNTSRSLKIYQDFIYLVQHNYNQHRQIAYYASKLCITPKYLSTIVKKESGRTAGEWIDDYVINEAKALLKNVKFTVLQVSQMLNFPSASFFAKFFRQHTGKTPTDYRNAD